MSEQQILQFIFRRRLLDRGKGDQRVRTRRRHGRGAHQYRTHRRHHRTDIRGGRGTTFLIKIPLTLAIVSALIVEAAGSVSPSPSSMSWNWWASPTARKRASRPSTPRRCCACATACCRWCRCAAYWAWRPTARKDRFVIVAQVGASTFGIIVDRVFDTEEIVVKPVAPILRGTRFYVGNTILGDGSVIMILDPNGLSNAAGQLDGSDAAAAQNKAVLAIATADQDLVPAVPRRWPRAQGHSAGAGLAHRKPAAATIENVGGRHVVQYREHLMPLVPFSRPSLEGKRQAGRLWCSATTAAAWVWWSTRSWTSCATAWRSNCPPEHPAFWAAPSSPARRWTWSISAISLPRLSPTGSKSAPCTPTAAARCWWTTARSSAIWSRRCWRPPTGKSATASDGLEALKLCEDGQHFDVIISDIEMPNLDGLALQRHPQRSALEPGAADCALVACRGKKIYKRAAAPASTNIFAKSDPAQLPENLTRACAEPAPTAAPTKLNGGPHERAVCLVVDEFRVIRRVAKDISKALDFTGRRPRTASKQWNSAHMMPEFILLDWNMPEMDGIGCLRTMRAMEPRRARRDDVHHRKRPGAKFARRWNRAPTNTS